MQTPSSSAVLNTQMLSCAVIVTQDVISFALHLYFLSFRLKKVTILSPKLVLGNYKFFGKISVSVIENEIPGHSAIFIKGVDKAVINKTSDDNYIGQDTYLVRILINFTLLVHIRSRFTILISLKIGQFKYEISSSALPGTTCLQAPLSERGRGYFVKQFRVPSINTARGVFSTSPFCISSSPAELPMSPADGLGTPRVRRSALPLPRRLQEALRLCPDS